MVDLNQAEVHSTNTKLQVDQQHQNKQPGAKFH